MTEPRTPEGYPCEGTHQILHWRAGVGVSSFIARSSSRGRRWLRFQRKIDHPAEFWVTGYRTKRLALGSCCPRHTPARARIAS